ncbi:MAG TPA: sigma-70 family RNA polymerase sigma factor [Candidatus Angelobacter sp.]|nr:sigma-70 family RNA polymerase sigma factor [Candidatus Angelobacter sp.]
MASSQQSAIHNLLTFAPATEAPGTQYGKIYQENCHRVYSLAFWMTDHELAAERLSENVFLRAFAGSDRPTPEQIDRAFLAEIREYMPIGTLTLDRPLVSETRVAGRNMKRVLLERAVLQLPATERLIFILHDVEGYNHGRIAWLFGLTERESQEALHYSRLKIRDLVATML